MTTTTTKRASGHLGKGLHACGLMCGDVADRRCTIAGVRLCRECFRRALRIRRQARQREVVRG